MTFENFEEAIYINEDISYHRYQQRKLTSHEVINSSTVWYETVGLNNRQEIFKDSFSSGRHSVQQ